MILCIYWRVFLQNKFSIIIWISLFSHCKVSAEKKRELGSQARKGKFIRGKREGDWPIRRTSILPFRVSPSYTPPMKNPLEAWLHSRGSGIWWSHSFEKIGASEITGCHLDNLVSLKGHCDLFFVCEVGITNHLNNETPCGPHQYPPLVGKGAFSPPEVPTPVLGLFLCSPFHLLSNRHFGLPFFSALTA